MKFVIRVIVNAVALWFTAWLIPAIELTSDILSILVVALVFGLVNALIKPIVKLLSLPITVITLGLFTLVINAIMLMITALLVGDWLTLGDNIFQAFLWAFVGSLVISIVSTILNWIIPDD